MEENKKDFHGELIVEFLDDCTQMLDEVTNLFILLEENPGNQDVINKVFRTIHTIKGNASLLSLQKIKKLAHVMEDLMNLVRQGSIEINAQIIDVLIKGIDRLQKIISSVRQSNVEVEDETDYQNFLMQITLIFDELRKTDPKVLWKTMAKCITEFNGSFSKKDKNLDLIWHQVMKSYGAYEACFLKNEEKIGENKKKGKIDFIQELKNILEQEFDEILNDEQSQKVFNLLKELEKKSTEDTVGHVQAAITEYESIFPEDGFTSFLAEIILEKIKEVKVKKNGGNIQEGASDDTASKMNKTMRIYESTIDHFLDLIGELVVVGETYDHIQKRFGDELGPIKAVSDLKKNNESFNDLSLELQGSVLGIRRVSLKTLLDRAPRIARDVAVMQDKKIHVDIKGDETLIDKSFLEGIDGPFVHMVRNAADHGIESPEERKAKGKDEEGLIAIRVSETEDTMRIVIRDDGAGIDKKVIVDSAIQKGVIPQAGSEHLGEKEIFDLLFEPGFSTAKEVTDVSGRGVGMDVVKKNIEGLGGEIYVESILGEGTTLIMEIPKTVCVKIIEGFLVEASGGRFVLPMKNVGESFRISSKEITTTLGDGECIMHHDKIFPVRRLDYLLNLNNDKCEKKDGVGVIMDIEHNKIVLFVDEVLGTQQVVIKDIEGLSGHSKLIAGGAILGDERVAVVLDLGSI